MPRWITEYPSDFSLIATRTQTECDEGNVAEEISGSKLEEVKGDWRKLHYEELRNLYSSPNIRVVKLR